MSKFNNFKNYNPDILETIANLSNDEVFTPPKLANDILDLLPKEIWSDSTITFLDPAVKTGIFLREITSRLIAGLADQIPDLQERVNHILTKQVFGIGITELTTLMARRTVYCSITANGKFSICTEFDDEKGNIIFPDTEHTWDKNGRCKYCGANRENYGGGGNKENYAYPFIHDNFEKEFGNMKFDVIIGNPPYQLSTGGGVAQATPLYNKFVEMSLDMNPKYISMIIPSRWMKGGMGLKDFRERIMNDTRMASIVDYQTSEQIFPSVSIDAGICYFLWDRNHNGKVNYKYIDIEGVENESTRFLKTNFYDKVIRDNRQLSIIEKVLSKNKVGTFNDIVAPKEYFGLKTFIFNQPERYKHIKLNKNRVSDDDLKIYGITGIAGGSKREVRYVDKNSITEGLNSINKYKIYFGKAFDAKSTTPPPPIKGEPGSLCTETFLKIGDFNTSEEMDNCLSYMNTKFFRALFHYNRSSFISSGDTFSLIPLQDWSKPWTDEELYKKYNLTEEEIAYIEDNIDSMGDQEDSEEAYPEDSVDLEEEEFED